MRLAFTPMTAALSRSMVTSTCGVWTATSLATSSTPGTCSTCFSSLAVSAYSSALSGVCMENWYRLLVTWPPIWMVGGFCR